MSMIEIAYKFPLQESGSGIDIGDNFSVGVMLALGSETQGLSVEPMLAELNRVTVSEPPDPPSLASEAEPGRGWIREVSVMV